LEFKKFADGCKMSEDQIDPNFSIGANRRLRAGVGSLSWARLSLIISKDYYLSQ